MESLLFKYELRVLNEGNSPTFQTRQAATCIDITVATPALASLVTKWTVQNEMHMLDHHLFFESYGFIHGSPFNYYGATSSTR
jgi:hypothetical protein